jgi:hypothetical protein
MRAHIRELTRSATLLAAVLVSVSPSLAAGLPRNFVAHTNQEGQQCAHSNQGSTIGLVSQPADPPAPAEVFVDIDVGTGVGLRGALSRAWADAGIPPDAGGQGAAGAVVGLRAPNPPGGGPGSAESALAPGPQGAIPTPGGLGFLALAALAGGRRQRWRGRRA